MRITELLKEESIELAVSLDSKEEAIDRLKGKVQPSGAYTYVPPKGPAPTAPPAPVPQPPKGKPKKGGLFGFFKK